MAAFLKFIGPYALQFGMWCLKNPGKVQAGVSTAETALADAKKVLDAIHAAKAKK